MLDWDRFFLRMFGKIPRNILIEDPFSLMYVLCERSDPAHEAVAIRNIKHKIQLISAGLETPKTEKARKWLSLSNTIITMIFRKCFQNHHGVLEEL